MEFDVPKRHILRPTLYTEMVPQVLRWEWQKRCYGRKRLGPMTEKCYYNNLLEIVLWGKEDKDKTKQENGQT